MPFGNLEMSNIGIKSNNLNELEAKQETTTLKTSAVVFILESRLAYLVKLCPTNFITSGSAVRQYVQVWPPSRTRNSCGTALSINAE